MKNSILPVPSKRKALLLAVPTYEADNVSKLTMVANDITLMKAALEYSKYTIDVAGVDPETKLTRTALLRKIRQFAKSSQEGDTLVLYFSGHGLHLNGFDYIVPADAAFDDPEMLSQYLVPVDFPGLFEDCLAGTILILIDACREGINLTVQPDIKSASATPWSEGRIAHSRRKQITYILTWPSTLLRSLT